MSITRDFTIYLNAGISVPPVVHVNQYDQGEIWRFTLLESDGSQYTPSTGALIGVKADGHAIAGVTGTVLGDGRVQITETQQMTAAAGDAIFELTIDGQTHGTANFIVRVEKKPTDDAILSDSDLSIIQQGIDQAERIAQYGSPLVATSSSQMTNHQSVYVYTGTTTTSLTNGHWYYWNGSAWADGGVYNSVAVTTDKTLTQGNVAADAKATGDAVSELKTEIRYFYSWEQGSLRSADGEEIDSAVRCRTDFIKVKAGDRIVMTGNGQKYNVFLYDLTKTFIASITGSATLRTVDSTVSINSDGYVRIISGRTSDGALTPPNVTVNADFVAAGYSAYKMVSGSGAEAVYTPDAYITDRGVIITNATTSGCTLAELKIDGEIFIDITAKAGGYWPCVWYLDATGSATPLSSGMIFENERLAIPDGATKVYAFSANSQATISMIGKNYHDVILEEDEEEDTTVHVGTGHAYTSLTEAILYAVNYPNTKVIVHKGTYDIISELKAKYGNDFFSTQNPSYWGLPLGNGIHVFFEAGAKAVADMSGSEFTTTNRSNFSMFTNVGSSGDFIIENADIECTDTRYCIHDERAGIATFYKSEYINCKMKHVKNAGSGAFSNVLGCGLGECGYILMTGCEIYQTLPEAETDQFTYDCYWHNIQNSSDGKAQSTIIIRDSWFENRGVRFDAFGNSQAVSRVEVCGCSATHAPYKIQTGSYDNISLKAWNNEVRTE